MRCRDRQHAATIWIASWKLDCNTATQFLIQKMMSTFPLESWCCSIGFGNVRRCLGCFLRKNIISYNYPYYVCMNVYMHVHVYIYICVCECVCVRAWRLPLERVTMWKPCFRPFQASSSKDRLGSMNSIGHAGLPCHMVVEWGLLFHPLAI